jgi:hypothetical protein
MPTHTATTGTQSVSVSARVIRADGRVEDLGTVAYWHRNPLKRWAWRLARWARGLSAGRITFGA